MLAKRLIAIFVFVLTISSISAAEPDLVKVSKMTVKLASDIAQKALADCNKKGYQVSVVVVDRNGHTQAVLRNAQASRFTLQIATEKANAVILSRIKSSAFRKNRGDIRPELNHVRGILMMQGGVPIRASGSLVGAIGVSGAPGGMKDEVCAKAGVKAVQERLLFAD